MTTRRRKPRRQAPGIFECPACHDTVAVSVEAVTWCLKCGRRMRRLRDDDEAREQLRARAPEL